LHPNLLDYKRNKRKISFSLLQPETATKQPFAQNSTDLLQIAKPPPFKLLFFQVGMP
jgi:hypothetical protein